ncbi:MAG: hypothetical protein ACOYBY_12815 [Dermatophilaceae bacterium]
MATRADPGNAATGSVSTGSTGPAMVGATSGAVSPGSVSPGSVSTGSVSTGSVSTGPAMVGAASGVASGAVSSGSGSVCCTGRGPRRASSSLITDWATPSRSAMACWLRPWPAHSRAWVTCRSDSLVGRPRRRTRPADPATRARPRRMDTYVAVNPNTAATSSTRRRASVNATIARLRIPMSSAW